METKKANKQKPKRLKGFNDFFAEDMKIREYVISVFKDVYEKYGYEPLETPALEYTEMMLDISGDEAEKMFYRFEDPGKRDVMLKYEVMTSMGRAVAQNFNNLPMPYKRYQIQRTWRAENTQKGRYREFTQCDVDTVGSDSPDMDAEAIQAGLEVLSRLDFKKFIVKISNRKFLEGLAEYLGVTEEQFYGYCMSLDKLQKIGSEKVIAELVEKRGVSQVIAEKTLKLINTDNYEGKSFREIITSFEDTVGSTEIGTEGLNELTQIVDYFEKAEVSEENYMFDTSLARGLASYTGPIWEFEVLEGNVGSVSGGGRYDKLLSKYLGQEIPATGGSFGIERICDIIKDRNMLDLGKTTTDIMITYFDEETLDNALDAGRFLRNEGFKVMQYPDAAKLGKQFKYADTKGIPYVVVIGSEEVEKGIVKVKDLQSREEFEAKLEELPGKLR